MSDESRKKLIYFFFKSETHLFYQNTKMIDGTSRKVELSVIANAFDRLSEYEESVAFGTTQN